MYKKMTLVAALAVITAMLASCGTAPGSEPSPSPTPAGGTVNTPSPTPAATPITTPAPADGDSVDLDILYGDWAITSHVASNPVSTYSQEAIDAMIGKELTCSETQVSFDGETLDNPQYKLSEESKSEHDEMNDVKFADLGITADAVARVDIYTDEAMEKSWINPVTGIYMKDADTLILIGEGEYFEATRK